MAKCGKSMRVWIPILILHVLSFSTFLLQITNGEYVEQFLESVEVCTSAAVGPFSNFAKKKIRLQNYPNNTVMIKMTRWEEFWPSFLNFRCKFQVTAPKKMGVMVVIQSMHLRVRNDNGLGCRDWIKFEQDDGFKTGQICGELEGRDYSKTPKGIVGQRFFYDAKGQMDISFSTDEADKGEEEKKPVFLKMIFTAYQECNEIGLSQGKLRRCSSLRSQSCIHSNLHCDGEINCGFNDSDFGMDEAHCSGSSADAGILGGHNRGGKTSRIGDGNEYLVAILIGMFAVCLLLCMGCCCLKKYNGWLWSTSPEDVVRQMNRRSRNQAAPPYPADLPLEFNMITAGSPLGDMMIPEGSGEKPTHSVDMDRPPAYDDLFPKPDPPQKK